MCIYKGEDPTQKYKRKFPKKYHRHHQPEGYQECNVKAAAGSGKVQWLLVNQQTRPGVSLKHFLYHFHDSNGTYEACTLLHSNTWYQKKEKKKIDTMAWPGHASAC